MNKFNPACARSATPKSTWKMYRHSLRGWAACDSHMKKTPAVAWSGCLCGRIEKALCYCLGAGSDAGRSAAMKSLHGQDLATAMSVCPSHAHLLCIRRRTSCPTASEVSPACVAVQCGDVPCLSSPRMHGAAALPGTVIGCVCLWKGWRNGSYSLSRGVQLAAEAAGVSDG